MTTCLTLIHRWLSGRQYEVLPTTNPTAEDPHRRIFREVVVESIRQTPGQMFMLLFLMKAAVTWWKRMAIFAYLTQLTADFPAARRDFGWLILPFVLGQLLEFTFSRESTRYFRRFKGVSADIVLRRQLRVSIPTMPDGETFEARLSRALGQIERLWNQAIWRVNSLIGVISSWSVIVGASWEVGVALLLINLVSSRWIVSRLERRAIQLQRMAKPDRDRLKNQLRGEAVAAPDQRSHHRLAGGFARYVALIDEQAVVNMPSWFAWDLMHSIRSAIQTVFQLVFLWWFINYRIISAIEGEPVEGELSLKIDGVFYLIDSTMLAIVVLLYHQISSFGMNVGSVFRFQADWKRGVTEFEDIAVLIADSEKNGMIEPFLPAPPNGLEIVGLTLQLPQPTGTTFTLDYSGSTPIVLRNPRSHRRQPVISLLGDSGNGKTTFLTLMTGWFVPNRLICRSGAETVDPTRYGRALYTNPEMPKKLTLRRIAGMLLTDPSVLTDAMIRELGTLLELDDFTYFGSGQYDMPIDDWSNGQKQRCLVLRLLVMLEVELARDSDAISFLMLDEALVNLHHQQPERILRKIIARYADRVTIVYMDSRLILDAASCPVDTLRFENGAITYTRSRHHS